MIGSKGRRLLLLGGFVLALGGGPAATSAVAEGAASWRLEQPAPPEPPVGVVGSGTPIGLGLVGDMQFWAPDRGLLITAGNGNTIPAGLWAYNGERWHLLSNVCGATDGRISWAGPEEFWTVSDGRPGQAANPKTGLPAPLEDNTLCHFSHGEVVGSYAAPAFQANSYQPMHAAGCISATDCWFAGDPLPEPENGQAFHLRWNGSSLTAEPSQQGHAVEGLSAFEGRLFESVRLSQLDAPSAEFETPLPAALHVINPSGVSPIFEPVLGLPLYSSEEFPEALDYLQLGADADSLWAAAGPVAEPPAGSSHAKLTVVRSSGGTWQQLLGPEAEPPIAIAEDVVESIAPEPGSEGAWMAVASRDDIANPTAQATIAHVGADGSVETQTLPSPGEAAEGIGPKGAAKEIVCPAAEDCWMITTQGWLFHLAPEGRRRLPAAEVDRSAAFSSEITFRPPDAGLPQVVPDAPPPDDSGLGERAAGKPSLVEIPTTPEAKVKVPLVSSLRSKLVHGTTTLELRFHLAVKAHVKLLAKVKKRVVASTSQHTFAAGNRKLLLRLDRKHWPTKLDLQAHALAPLPEESTRLPGNNTVGTGVVTLPGTPGSPTARSLIAPFEGTLP
jgi:hypothetical protein